VRSDYWLKTYATVGCLSFVLACWLVPIGILLLRRLGVMDQTAANKIHTRPIPRGGGVFIFIAFLVAVLYPGYRSDGMNGILIGALICLVVGMIDDWSGGIPGFYKLITIAVVTLVLAHYGVRLKFFRNDVLDIGLTMLWIVGVTSALNGADNMDGLASGITAIVAAMFLFIACQVHLHVGTEHSLSWFGMLAAGLLGANLGFLLFNSKPAVVFMGDSGSFFLGFTIAALGVMGEWNENRLIACAIPVLILGVPIFDFAYIIIARIWRGETRTLRSIIDHCAPDHLSHRLVWLGFTERKAVWFIYLICVVLGVSGVLLRTSNSLLDAALALLQGLSVLAIVFVLMTSASRRLSRPAPPGTP